MAGVRPLRIAHSVSDLLRQPSLRMHLLDLDQDILMEIFQHLTITQLWRLAAVSKTMAQPLLAAAAWRKLSEDGPPVVLWQERLTLLKRKRSHALKIERREIRDSIKNTFDGYVRIGRMIPTLELKNRVENHAYCVDSVTRRNPVKMVKNFCQNAKARRLLCVRCEKWLPVPRASFCFDCGDLEMKPPLLFRRHTA